MTPSKRKSTTPNVTVLLPVYNGERYLSTAIDSILSQTFTDFELLLVDDGSTDGSRARMEQYDDPRIRIIRHPKNQGLIATLNHGLQEAKGEYLARMDADDVSLPTRFEKQVKFLNSHSDVHMVAACCRVMDADGRETGEIRPSREFSQNLVRWSLLWGNPVIHPTVMARLSVLRKVGGYPAVNCTHAEDHALFLNLFTSGYNIHIMREPLIYYRCHSSSITGQHYTENFQTAIRSAAVAFETILSIKPDNRLLEVCWIPLNELHPTRSEVSEAVRFLMDSSDVFFSVLHCSGTERMEIKEWIRTRILDMLDVYYKRSFASRMRMLFSIGRYVQGDIVGRKGLKVMFKYLLPKEIPLFYTNIRLRLKKR